MGRPMPQLLGDWQTSHNSCSVARFFWAFSMDSDAGLPRHCKHNAANITNKQGRSLEKRYEQPTA